ncbi:double-strand break repair helicase AddA [Actibacterium sp. XHP0104]|uniref:double-strand break repair helicase AddA n=1 Tax=Actibacterium sp. XHP0104 TaxID=2984335 RepID=UPI0021E887E7|nr:double-strand break repair helicase AddA [Actibacterium sp. XHP0104]MCV2882119.1 double-strand break repair helicase AddA [Actibacterium sp. XHP0104]
MRRDAASERQVQAARPECSTWLSANAGSGKTRVLTNRVARLLLNGVEPQQILCLTYTKAAASEMQNRLFQRLGEWAMLDQRDLINRLADLGLDHRPDDATLRRARQLFARAIETPGGLKIQTIHSFCAAILRRFPLEAGVSPQFVEMDDRAAQQLRAEIVDEMAQGADAGALIALARHMGGADINALTAEIASRRADFPTAPDAAAIWAAHGLPADLDEAGVLSRVFLGSEESLLSQLVPALLAGSSLDVRAGAALAGVRAPFGLADLEALEGPFLTGKSAKTPFGAKIGSFPTKDTRAGLAGLMPQIEQLMQRVADTRPLRLGLMSARKTLALHQFAAPFLRRYDDRKLRHGWLDFDDLILKTRALLTDPDVAEWVLFKLDGGIDHILVDEAQDTSPLQWQVIDLLSREFAAGQGARDDIQRTIFVVGDKKQSIYSFQGADPDGFDQMCDHFHARLPADTPLVTTQLEYSFRSSPAILGVVDNTFHENARRGIGDDILHRAFNADLPGRVDLWAPFDKSGSDDPEDWEDPRDLLSPEHHVVRLANQIAAQIAHMIENESLADKDRGRRPLRAGDVLILVQRRSELFHEIIRACKSAGLPVAGADRLKIGGELAVKDLTALLAFLATPEDDYALACALKSPLFGWDEAMLYRLAAGRGRSYLWAALRDADWAGTETVSMLSALMRDADFLRPYDLIERVLTRHDGRRRLIARLGEEAEDGIDALLSQALAYERSEVPSLTGFLTWMQSGEVEIKRQPDSAGDRIRVMTVHGSKGLEAPVVILPDTAKREIKIQDHLLANDDAVLWKTNAEDAPPAIEAAMGALRDKQEEERNRLLYVAMTRAEQWLITCAAGELDKGNSWYERVAEGMQRSGAVVHEFANGPGLRLELGDWSGAAETAARDTPPAPELPGWARQPVPTPERPPQLVSPSDLGGAKALPGEGEGLPEDQAKLRGTHLHLLLEHLPNHPPEQRPALARRLIGAEAPPWFDAIYAETETILTAPHLSHVFTPHALCEVEITAHLPGFDAPILGAIDRLIVGPDHVLAIDYKSNAVVPGRPEDVPGGILRQMGAYAAALEQIYPGRRIETAILWTATAQLMTLPSQLVAVALRDATTS